MKFGSVQYITIFFTIFSNRTIYVDAPKLRFSYFELNDPGKNINQGTCIYSARNEFSAYSIFFCRKKQMSMKNLILKNSVLNDYTN